MDDFYAKAVCKAAVHTYGKEHQKLIAIEEMSELTKALCKDDVCCTERWSARSC